MKKRIADIVAWKNLTIEKAYANKAIQTADIVAYFEKYGLHFVDYICDTGLYLTEASKQNKNILFEAQLGALRDIDFGIYPYTSSSSTISAYAPIGAGAPNLKIDNSIGIMKAYSTCVGEGPFVTEYHGDKAEELRIAGGEYGAVTKRPRRVGPFDAVASKYGIRCQGATEIALTKLDVLSRYKEIEICIAYAYKEQELTKKYEGSKILGIHSEGPWLNRTGEKGIRRGWPEVKLEMAQEMVKRGKGYLKLVALAQSVQLLPWHQLPEQNLHLINHR